MQQFRLINGSGKVGYPGDLCKLHATKGNSFDLAVLGDVIIGTLTQKVNPGGWAILNPQGMVDWSNIQNKPQRGPRNFVSINEPDHVNLLPGDIWINPLQLNTSK